MKGKTRLFDVAGGSAIPREASGPRTLEDNAGEAA
jgi:hypothetical protein